MQAPNKNFNLTGTAIGEFDFLVLAISYLKYLSSVRRMFQQVKLTFPKSQVKNKKKYLK